MLGICRGRMRPAPSPAIPGYLSKVTCGIFVLRSYSHAVHWILLEGVRTSMYLTEVPSHS